MTDQLEDLVRTRFADRAAAVTEPLILDEVTTRIARSRQRRLALATGTCVLMAGLALAGTQVIRSHSQVGTGPAVATSTSEEVWKTNKSDRIAFRTPKSWQVGAYKCAMDNQPLIVLPDNLAKRVCDPFESPTKELVILLDGSIEPIRSDIARVDFVKEKVSSTTREVGDQSVEQDIYRLSDGRYAGTLKPTSEPPSGQWIVSARTLKQETLMEILSSVEILK